MIDSYNDRWSREVEELIARVRALMENDPIVPSPGVDSWNHIVQQLMLRQQLTLSTAESCTGGFMASQITEVPGSSGYFMGSVVSYANSVKENVLGVSATTLANFGAVSSQCAEEMLAGVLDVIKSDVAIAVTGIAGPGGGSAEKPVGTVFVSVGSKNRHQTIRINCDRDRKGIVLYTYHRAMDLLYRFLTAGENQ